MRVELIARQKAHVAIRPPASDAVSIDLRTDNLLRDCGATCVVHTNEILELVYRAGSKSSIGFPSGSST
jgi:hypothetical protein